MNPSEFQKLAMRTECDQQKARERYQMWYSPNSIRMNHAIIGLMGEVGELASLMEKWLHYGQQYPLERIKDEVSEEAGDCLWYIALLLTSVGLDMNETMDRVIRKLQARYPEKFTTEASKEENRDREKEKVWAHDVEKGQRSLPEKVKEIVEKTYIGQETNLKVGTDVPIPELIQIQGKMVCPECYGTREITVMGSRGRPSHQEDCPSCIRRDMIQAMEDMKNKQKEELEKLLNKEQKSPAQTVEAIKLHDREKPKTTRTKEEVLKAREKAVMGGCCNTFADNQSCDCLEKATLFKWSAETHPSHQWGKGSINKERRCLKCGAYRNLLSGFTPCKEEFAPLTEVDNHGFGHTGPSEFAPSPSELKEEGKGFFDDDPKPKEA